MAPSVGALTARRQDLRPAAEPLDQALAHQGLTRPLRVLPRPVPIPLYGRPLHVANTPGPRAPGLLPLPAQRGVLIGVAGHPVLLEIFDHPDTLAEQWDAILSSVALDAVALPVVPTPGYRARAFVRRACATPLNEAAPAGAGLAIGGTDQRLVSVRGIQSDHLLHAAVVNVQHQLVLAA